MHMTLTQLVLGGSTLLALSAVGIALGVALWMAFSSAVLGQKTCSQCGAQLPVLGQAGLAGRRIAPLDS
jgi:hypothetical protein